MRKNRPHSGVRSTLTRASCSSCPVPDAVVWCRFHSPHPPWLHGLPESPPLPVDQVQQQQPGECGHYSFCHLTHMCPNMYMYVTVCTYSRNTYMYMYNEQCIIYNYTVYTCNLKKINLFKCCYYNLWPCVLYMHIQYVYNIITTEIIAGWKKVVVLMG